MIGGWTGGGGINMPVSYPVTAHWDGSAVATGVERTRAQAANSMAGMRSAVERAGQSVENLAFQFKALFGFLVGREMKKQFMEMLNFARENQTSAGALVAKFDLAVNHLRTAVVESEAFKRVLAEAATAFDFGAALISNKEMWDAFVAYMKATWEVLMFVLKETFARTMNFVINFITPVLGQINLVLVALGKEPIKLFDVANGLEMLDVLAEMQIAEGNLAEAFAKARGGLKSSQKTGVTGAVYGLGDLQENERMIAQKQQWQRESAAIVERADWLRSKRVEIANDMARQEKEAIDAIGYAWVDGELVNVEALERQAEAMADFKDGILQDFVSGFVQGFASIGEAIVKGTNPLKAFGNMLLKTIGQMAMQFGQFLILTGLGMNSVSVLFGLSGASAVAAGVALTILGGALSAAASKSSPTSSAQSARDASAGSFREPGRNRGSAAGGGVSVVVNLNSPEWVQIPRKQLLAIGEAIGQQLQENISTGRWSVQGG